MRNYRTDAPHTNPSIRVDCTRKARLNQRVRTDAEDTKRDAADRLRARRDAALADVKSQHKRKRGFSRDDLREGPSKPQAAPNPAMDADAAAEAIKAQSKGAKA